MWKLLIPAAALLSFTQFGRLAGVQTPTPTQSGTTLHATANEVLLDFVVRDKHRKIVKNLKPGEVQISEDGVPQKILSFRLAEGYEAQERQQSQAKGAKPAKAPAVRTTSTPQTLRKVNLICIVFHNQDNLDQTMKKYRLEAVQEFLGNQMQPDTWIGVFSLGSRLTVLHPFTGDRADLLRAVANNFTGGGGTFQLARVADAVLNGTPNLDVIEGFTAPGGRSGGATETLQTGRLNPAVITGVEATTGLAADAQRGDLVGQQRQFGGIEGMRQMDQMNVMIQELGVLPGHKTVLLLSPGLTTRGDPDFFQSTLTRANQANITVYALDTNGLSENSNVQAGNEALKHVVALSQQQGKPVAAGTTGGVGQEAELMRQDDYLHQAVRTSDTQASLRALAEGTGGFLIANTNDLRKPFQKLMQDVGAHYEAVYHPTSDKYDGRLRKIEVKLARPDLTVETRVGYFAIPDIPGSAPLKPLDVAGLMVLNAQPRPHAFEFRSAAFQFRPGSEGSQYAVTYDVPVSSLTATPEPPQMRHHLHVSLFALVKDSSGQVVDKFSQDAPYEIPDGKLAALATTSIPYSHLLSLPPGRYTVETAVLDREGSRAAANEVVFDSPESKGIGLSSVMLVKQMETATGQPDPTDPFRVGNNRVTPELATTLSESAKPYVYFVVYPDKASSEKPRVEIQLLLNGQLLANRVEELPAADAAGAVPMLFGSVAKPGNCELKIIATQGAESLERSVKYTVVAN
jgi:VWFA-related protein